MGMFTLKYIGLALGGLALLGLLAFGGLVFFMASASKSGYKIIATLQKEFPVGRSIDEIIGRAQELGVNSISLDTNVGKDEFEDGLGIPVSLGESKKKIDFKLVQEKLQGAESGNILLLAYGSMVLERFILSIVKSRKRLCVL